ncbi:sulfatase-like hydrolase/transferase [Streptomyces sp. NBC_00340]|uniref:sulfatase-like hydrolase/transferase n=1 Tax=Streptomyces sp. NBC_00340 TaxID=2975716 RepID=UPI0022572865|nr:sulfatase-like hydrolase/transferase [Streptomyces sp. NBC_00340]MCX5131317.1 sulfatase-like hydrolase/transferase [Streptomyces sp. NBC_00340]
MSFTSSSRQLPNTDETPERETPEPDAPSPGIEQPGPAPQDASAGAPDHTRDAATDAEPGQDAPSSGPEQPAPTAEGQPAVGTAHDTTDPEPERGETDAEPEPVVRAPEGEVPAGSGAGSSSDEDDGGDVGEEPVSVSSPPSAGHADAGTDGSTDEGGDEGGETGPAAPSAGGVGEAAPPSGRVRGWRGRYPVAATVLAWTVTGLAAVLVLFALLMPGKADQFHPAQFLRVPVEAVFGAALVLVLPRRPRIAVSAVAGLALGVLTVLNLLDVGFNEYLGRGFNVVLDWALFSDAQAYLQDTFGGGGALGIAILAVVLVIAVLALVTLSVVRLGSLVARNSEAATRATLVAAIVWVTCAALGVQVTGVPIASEHVALAVQDRAHRVRDTIRDEAEFQKIAKKDTFANTPPDQLLTDLRGKDMMITFIESYGRSAIEDPVMAPGVDATLTAENKKLTGAGFAAKSGWLTSATYGGSSWLGHSTFLSGLWINNQQRYRTVTAGDHLTLPGAFKKTGDWDTVGVMPGVQKAWPEQKFYGIDKLYDSRDLGYRGPKFSWSTMPDQYALTAFERLVHGKKHDKPLMSTIILTSSHQPWAPIPRTVPQDQVGDGSVYDAIEKAGKRPGDIITDARKSKEEYGKSIQYSVTSLIDYLVKYGDKNTVLIFLGDHQPIARVSGDHASRDVPVSIVAKDPKVLDRIADWGWTDGLRPEHNAPVWKMSAFRDRFLTAYGSTPHS